MWRPNDWKNPHIPMQKEPFRDLADSWFRDINDKRYRAYEAGADAILGYLVGEGYLEDAFIMDEDPEEEDDGDN